MKKFILLGIALALSWSSCQKSSFTDAFESPPTDMQYRPAAPSVDLRSSSSEAEDIVVRNLEFLLDRIFQVLSFWTPEQIQALLDDEQALLGFIETNLTSTELQLAAQDLADAIRVLVNSKGQSYLRDLIAQAALAVSPTIGPIDEGWRGTPCFDKYQEKANLTALAYGTCLATSGATGIGALLCTAAYAGAMLIHEHSFYRCLNSTYGY